MEEKRPFYPYVNKENVYLTSLQFEKDEAARALYSKAQSLVESSASFFSSPDTLKNTYSQLRGLISTERAAEQNFISSKLKLNLEEVQQYGFRELITSFNKILNLESTFNTNVKRILDMKDGQLKNGQVDRLYALLNYTFPTKMGTFVGNLIGGSAENLDSLERGEFDEQIKTKAASIISDELIRVYGEKGRATNEYQELSQLMQNQVFRDQLVSKILYGYGITPEQLKKSLSEERKSIREGKSKRKMESEIKGKNLILQRQGGNAFEIIVNQILETVSSSFQGKAIATGKLNNMKADHIITIGLDGVQDNLQQAVENQKGQGERSNRIKNIQAMEDFFNDIKEMKGEIVFISDKNYRLDAKSFAEEKGFSAESPSFKNLGGVLTKAKVANLEELIFVLANTGSGRINQQVTGIERFLATKIANFLFDDVVITEELNKNVSSIKRIHVFNLDNIYVPLSVFLEATLFALENSLDYTNFVNVEISPAELSYSEQTDGLTEQDWNNLYNQSINNGKVAMHFFGNFINFISQYLR